MPSHGREGVIFSSPGCQLQSQRRAFVNTSTSCQESDWSVGEKLRLKPRVTQLPLSASDGRQERSGEGGGGS